jgi:hypothetical protein
VTFMQCTHGRDQGDDFIFFADSTQFLLEFLLSAKYFHVQKL